tara:strand:- start:770 stop:1009 length:240 start_codon:yes stop_codon:yes gene_type:complete
MIHRAPMTKKEMLDNIDIDGIQRERENLEHMPNQKWHQIVSFVKSGIRLGGYFLLLFNLEVAVGILILSEIIGIVEELV